MEQAPNDWEGMLRATIRVLAIAGKYDELLKALKLKAQLEGSDNAEGMYEKALLSLEIWFSYRFLQPVFVPTKYSIPFSHMSNP